jgi:hypothetical protein
MIVSVKQSSVEDSPGTPAPAALVPERQDVRAHLIGGVPVSEVEARSSEFRAVGLDKAAIFVPATEPSQLSLFDQRPEPLVDEAYLAFRQELVDREALEPAVLQDPGVRARRAALQSACARWWTEQAAGLTARTAGGSVARLRSALVGTLVAAIAPLGALDMDEVQRAAEAWWAAIEPDVRTLRAHGSFLAVMRGRAGDGGGTQVIPDRTESEARAEVLAIWGKRQSELLTRELDRRLAEVVTLVEHWWDTYRMSLRALEVRRSDVKARFDALVRELGYV